MPDHSPDPYESDEEEGFPWDFDNGGDLGNYEGED
jgi:hypothetical protein